VADFFFPFFFFVLTINGRIYHSQRATRPPRPRIDR
jgi:hypothetical protein